MSMKIVITNERMKRLFDGHPYPRYETPGAAAFDLRAAIDEPLQLWPMENRMIPTGLKVAVPEGHVGLIAPRSGLGARAGLVLSNLTGVIDSDYRGEVKVAAWNRNEPGTGDVVTINPMDRIAQMMIVPVRTMTFEIVESLDETQRGDGGFGHTG